MQSEIKRTK